MDIIKIGILEPEDFSEYAIEEMSHYASVELYRNEGIDAFIKDKTALFVRLRYDINDSFIQRAGRLKYICSPTTGLNHIRITNDSIQIISLKGEREFLASIRATPEHVFGLSLALLRNYGRGAFLSVGNREWNRDKFKGYEVYGLKIGIIGYGRIGKILSKYYNAFGAKVGVYDIETIEQTKDVFVYDTLAELITNSDLIILEANYSENNREMIDSKYLHMLKGKYFINAARGELVEENELLSLIEKDFFNGVALDVVSNEEQTHNNIDRFIDLTRNHNLILTPHIGGATYTSMKRTEEFIAHKLVTQLQKR